MNEAVFGRNSDSCRNISDQTRLSRETFHELNLNHFVNRLAGRLDSNNAYGRQEKHKRIGAKSPFSQFRKSGTIGA